MNQATAGVYIDAGSVGGGLGIVGVEGGGLSLQTFFVANHATNTEATANAKITASNRIKFSPAKGTKKSIIPIGNAIANSIFLR